MNYLIEKYLIESYVFLEDKFIKNVENFIFKNDKKYLDYIAKYKNKIPSMFKSPNTLYRGMILSNEIFDKIENGYKIKDYSSWTSDANIAKKFITDKKYKIKNEKGNKVIFKKIMSNEIILDIFSYILYLDNIGKLDEVEFDELTKDSALKEKEFICDKDIVLRKDNIFKIIK